MKVYYDLDLQHFKAWSGAVNTLATLTTEQIDQLEVIIEEMYPDGTDETTINDILWFEPEEIAKWLGYKSWEVLEKANSGEDNITIKIYNIVWDPDDNEPNITEVTHTFEGYYDADIEDNDLYEEICDFLQDTYGCDVSDFEIIEV